jgi:hypothetical protein
MIIKADNTGTLPTVRVELTAPSSRSFLSRWYFRALGLDDRVYLGGSKNSGVERTSETSICAERRASASASCCLRSAAVGQACRNGRSSGAQGTALT